LKLLITGGAGFVGTSLALAFKRESPQASIVAFDNLRRRGSELNIGILRRHGIDFVHGDVRARSDLESLAGSFDWLIDAAAEPSVLAGVGGSPAYVIETNLGGTANCLEFCRGRVGNMIFLSTSRVYSLAPLHEIRLREGESRFEIEEEQQLPGISQRGISEEFPTHLPRSFYGASKLASELLIQEYAAHAGVGAIINRCGTIAGPGQFGKVDQGVFTLWVAHHYFRKPLSYMGYGGGGKQVRDLLHPQDLYELLQRQMNGIEQFSGSTFNVGGGLDGSASLGEYTALCREATGNEIRPSARPETGEVDIPLYVSDNDKVSQAFGWVPRRGAREIVGDVADWIKRNEEALRPIFG
jgi:CDP-paratose 2-epimerase